MSNQLESEKLAYAYLLRRFKDDGNAKMVRTLGKADVAKLKGSQHHRILAIGERHGDRRTVELNRRPLFRTLQDRLMIRQIAAWRQLHAFRLP